jgi:TPR repeat protein
MMSKWSGIPFWAIVFILGIGLVFAAIGFVYAGHGDSSSNPESNFVMSGQVYSLTDNEVQRLADEALGGTAEGAFRLYLFFELVKGDHLEALFWLQIAAENGHPIGQYNFGGMLRKDPDPRNRQRARFWFERAAENGVSGASERLKEISE